MTDAPVGADELDAAAALIRTVFGIAPCPGCAVETCRSPAGHVTYCLRCSERALGLSAAENSRRIEANMSIAAWLRRPVDEPWPEPRANATRRRLGR